MGAVELLVCPVCGAGVSSDGAHLFCLGKKRHLYDIASSGYVNLLPPGRMSNSRAGDDKTMIRSRSEFLDRGYYSKISERAAQLIAPFANGSHISFADLACGEGYHTCNVIKSLSALGVSSTALGFDASKYGAEKGAKRARHLPNDADVFFAAANIFSLPVKDSSLDAATCLFAPIPWEESARVLKDGGRLLVASSGERHLFELREALYDEPRTASGEVAASGGFTETHSETLSYRVTLGSNEDIMSLFGMTPFFYRTSPRDAEKLSRLDSLDVTVEVRFTIFEKKHAGDKTTI